ncbi:MAG TPA: hypothetical protein VGK77_25255 [Candidatus Binatia bacterium]
MAGDNLPAETKKSLTIFTRPKEFSTTTVDNFVDYSPQCRADQPPAQLSANCLSKRQKKSLYINLFQNYGVSLNWDSLPEAA